MNANAPPSLAPWANLGLEKPDAEMIHIQQLDHPRTPLKEWLAASLAKTLKELAHL